MTGQPKRAMLAVFTMLMIGVSGLAYGQSAPVPMSVLPGWKVTQTMHQFPDLVRRVEEAVKANGMGVVNAASASDGAKAQGITIPGNRVIGVFRNDYARRMLTASLPAGIEAPIRFYLTENADSSATLSYRTPSAVFAPYIPGAGSDLAKLAEELDVIFAKIASDAGKAAP